MIELIRLTKQHQESTLQAALSARTGSIQQIEAIQGVTEALSKQKKQQKETDDEASAGRKKTVSDMDELGKQVRSFATLVGSAFAIDRLMNFGQGVIEAKTQIDSLKVSLDVMLGSKAESAKLYASIVETAKATPYSLSEIAEQVTRLKAYNVATSDLIPTINALGNMAAAVGKDKLPQITLAYGQIMNLGKLMGTEIKQMVDAGIPLYDILADSMKKPKAEVIALAAEHKIMAADVKKAIMDTSEVGGRFYGLMALQSKTVGGEVDKMKDSYQQAKVMIGDFFENTIQSGTRQLNNLMESTIGSNTAIQRTWDIVRSVAAAMVTYTIATKAQASADLIVTAYQATKNVLYGEYLLAMRAATAQQIVFTAAETEAVVAAEAFNVALSSNPIGLVITLLGALTTGYFAYKAVTDEVTSSLGEEELKLKSQRQELSDLIITASLAAEGTKQRKDAIQLLVDKYPEYFKGINTETATNDQLRNILDKVNASYQIRIDLARQAYKVDQAKSAQTELFKMEDELFARVTKTNVLNEEVIATFGGSAAKLLEYMNANKKAAYDLNTTWTGFHKQSIGQLATDIAKQQSDVSSALGDANKSIQKAKTEQIEADKVAENLRWNNSLSSLKKGSAEYTAAQQQHLDNLAKIDGAYHEKEVKAVADTAEKKKQIQLVSDKEWAVIKKGNDAENEIDRMKELKSQLDFLDKQEEAEAASVRKAQVNKKISNAALAALQEDARTKLMAIDAKYDKLRAEVMAQVEVETQKTFLAKVQESNDKIAVLTAKRVEAEAMLTRLNDAKTNEDRLAALKVYNEKYKDSVNTAAVEELKIQRDNSREVLDDIILTNGRKGDEYRKAYAAWLKDNEQYETALTKQTVDSAATTAKSIEKYEKEIQQARQETARIEKDTLEQTNQNRKEFLTGMANLLSKDGGFLGQIAGGIVQVYNGLDTLQLKALEGAKSTLSTAQNTLQSITAMYDNSTAEGGAKIAKATEDVAKAKNGVAEAQGQTLSGVLSIMSTLYTVFSSIAAAYNNMMKDTYLAIADGLGKARDSYKQFYNYVAQASAESHRLEMESFNGSLAERIQKVDDYYAKEKVYAEGADRVDATLKYYQQIAQLQADAGTDSGKIIEGLIRLQADKLNENLRNEIAAAEQSKVHAKELLDVKLAYIDQQTEAFNKAKQAEITAEEEKLAKLKALNEQYSSDDQLRLTADDLFRQGLLQQGEAREVAFLEAAKQRELVRAQERGATAEETQRIITAFDQLISEKHAEYQDAIGNKSKEISLANQETKAQEKDKVDSLEAASAKTIQGLQDQVRDNEKNAALARLVAETEFANAKRQLNIAIAEANKQLLIAELRTEVAVLEAKKNFANQGTITAAQNQIIAVINQLIGQGPVVNPVEGIPEQTTGPNSGTPIYDAFTADGKRVTITYQKGHNITVYDANKNEIKVKDGIGYIPDTGQYFFKGTDYAELGKNPKGRDTIPARINEGERILPTDDNLRIGGKHLSNERLIEKVLGYDRLMTDFPKYATMTMPQGGMVMRLPDNIMNSQGGSTIDVSALEAGLKRVERAVQSKKLVAFNIDQRGLHLAEETHQSKMNYYSKLMQG